jgi:hypothetical protein
LKQEIALVNLVPGALQGDLFEIPLNSFENIRVTFVQKDGYIEEHSGDARPLFIPSICAL